MYQASLLRSVSNLARCRVICHPSFYVVYPTKGWINLRSGLDAVNVRAIQAKDNEERHKLLVICPWQARQKPYAPTQGFRFQHLTARCEMLTMRLLLALSRLQPMLRPETKWIGRLYRKAIRCGRIAGQQVSRRGSVPPGYATPRRLFSLTNL